MDTEPSRGLSLDWHRAVPQDWDTWLSQVQGASFSVQAGFLDALSIYPPNSEIRILTASRGGVRVGALPMLIEHKWGVRWLRSMSFGTYGGPLTLRGESQPEGIRNAMIREMSRWMEGASIVSGQICLPPADPDSKADPRLSSLADTVTSEIAHVLDLRPGVETIHANLKRETRKGFRRAEREGVVVSEDAEALPEIYQLYRHQAKEWGVRKPYPLAFLSRLLEHPSGFARLFVARVEDRLQAGVLALSGGGETFLWWSGSAAEARQTLAFPYLLFQILMAASERGESLFNIGSSGGNARIERFKESLSAQPRRVWIFRLASRRPGLRGSLIRFALRVRGRS